MLAIWARGQAPPRPARGPRALRTTCCPHRRARWRGVEPCSSILPSMSEICPRRKPTTISSCPPGVRALSRGRRPVCLLPRRGQAGDLPLFLSRAGSGGLFAASPRPPAPRLSHALACGGAYRLRGRADPGVAHPGPAAGLSPVSAPLLCRVLGGARRVHVGSRLSTDRIEDGQAEQQEPPSQQERMAREVGAGTRCLVKVMCMCRRAPESMRVPPISSTNGRPLPQGRFACRTTPCKNLCPLDSPSAGFSAFSLVHWPRIS